MNRCLLLLRHRSLVCAAVALLASAVLAPVARANPVPVTYGGTVYNVNLELLNGVNDDAARLASQVWYGDSNLAAYFASQVGAALGTQNFGFEGPYFVFSNDGTTWLGNFYATHDPFANLSNVGGYSDIYQYSPIASVNFAGRFAFVESSSPVATPDAGATGGLVLLAVGMMGIARRRFLSRAA